ncbi:MAG: hypothetical protein QM528_07075 [Phycisphaerales bacterium]|nr:hypothetical protein [Phycisphaerales bacterium]
MEEKDFFGFLQTMLNIAPDFAITKINKIEQDKEIRIYLQYLPKVYCKKGLPKKSYKIYDYLPERSWQHLSWFEYRCYIVCSLPRYVDEDGKPKQIEVDFADSRKGYTRLFAQEVIHALREIKVQKAVAKLFKTTPYIVCSIMQACVEEGLKNKKPVTDLTHISLDEKAYQQGHAYATILVDTSKNQILDMQEGRTEKEVKTLGITKFCVRRFFEKRF